MAYSKIIYGGNVLIDLTGDTVAADKLLAGVTAHGERWRGDHRHLRV